MKKGFIEWIWIPIIHLTKSPCLFDKTQLYWMKETKNSQKFNNSLILQTESKF